MQWHENAFSHYGFVFLLDYCSNLDAGNNYSAHACLSHLVVCFRDVPERVTTLKQMILGLKKVGY